MFQRFQGALADVVAVESIVKMDALHALIGFFHGAFQICRRGGDAKNPAAACQQLLALALCARHVGVRGDFGGHCECSG